VIKKKENRGGARKGAGRKKDAKYFSDQSKMEWQMAGEIIRSETGKSIEEHLCRMIIDPDVQDSVKASIAKIRQETLTVKQSEQTIETKQTGPMIGLPPIAPKPKAPPVEKEQEEVRVH
jgi:hypothetical protein